MHKYVQNGEIAMSNDIQDDSKNINEKVNDLLEQINQLKTDVARNKGRFEGASNWNSRLNDLENDVTELKGHVKHRKTIATAIAVGISLFAGWQLIEIPRMLSAKAVELAQLEIEKEAKRVAEEEFGKLETQQLVLKHIPIDTITEIDKHIARVVTASKIAESLSEKARKSYESLDAKVNENGELVFPEKVVFSKGIGTSDFSLLNGGVTIHENSYGGGIKLNKPNGKLSVTLESASDQKGRVRVYNPEGGVNKELY